jgi:molybdate transport system permease protein
MNAGLPLLLKSAAIVCSIAFVLALPIAWWLARWQNRLTAVVRIMLLIPVVVPSAALALWFGRCSAGYLSAVVFSMPFAVFPLIRVFSATSDSALDAAASLGVNPLHRILYLGLAPAVGRVFGGIGLCLARAFAELCILAPANAGNRIMGVTVLGVISLALLAVYGLGRVERREIRA